MEEIKTINEIAINWNKKPSQSKIFQIEVLKRLIKTLNPSQIFQYQPLDNFKKKAWDKEKDYSFYYPKEASQDLTLLFDEHEIIDIFFNRVVPITETFKDYLPSCTLIICRRNKENRSLIVITEFDFSSAKLRKRFTGYKYLRGDFKKYYVTSSKLNKRDQLLVMNNKFKLFRGVKI